MKIKPLADRVVVKPQEAEETTASGIILPDINILPVSKGVDDTVKSEVPLKLN